jgi:cytochrome b6-f complex iron-sulfur subunit
MDVHPELVAVTRRQLFNRSLVGLVGLGLAGFSGSVLAFLWPRPSGTFGSTIQLGAQQALLATIRETRQPVYVSAGRFYVVERDGTVDALYQRCVHLGCRVPFCASSQWFECACHNSMYNRVGEWKAGPAPRGLDRFPVTVGSGEQVAVDTGTLLIGPPHGTNTTGQEAEGPHCVRMPAH